MSSTDILTLVAFFVVIIISLPLLGEYMAKVFTGEKNILSPVVGKIESGFYRLSGVDPSKEMHYNCLLYTSPSPRD